MKSMKTTRPSLGCVITMAAFLSGWCRAIDTVDLTVNGRLHPMGISPEEVSFGWQTRAEKRGEIQSGYQIRVTDAGNHEVLWDSGKTESAGQTGIELPQSVRLKPASRYEWQVRTWDGKGQDGAWSPAASFETGLAPGSWADASWIGSGGSAQDPGWQDYSVQVDFSLKEIAFGVLLRASSDARDAYMCQIRIENGSPQLVIHRRTHGEYGILETVDLKTKGITAEQLVRGRHVLEFQLKGVGMSIMLDGKTIHQRSDLGSSGGWVGLRTYGKEKAEVYRVTVKDSQNQRVLLDTDFRDGRNPFRGGKIIGKCLTITGNTDALHVPQKPLPLLRRGFVVGKGLKEARIYASALGLYEISLNGRKVGDQFLAPGWTDYSKRIQSQSYDVTSLVQDGKNAIGVELGDGWYRGKVGLGWRRVYGDELGFIAKVRLRYDDGREEWIGTDASWKCSDSPRLIADLQDGEEYDARLEQPGWNTPVFDDRKWNAVKVLPIGTGMLVPQPDEPVRMIGLLPAKSGFRTGDGAYAYDLGQNMVGVARVTLKGKKGQTVKIRYAEELYRTGDLKGALYTDNFRSARVLDFYTFAKDGIITFEPKFTQHGFRYLEISGIDTPPTLDEVKGVVRGSDLRNTGELTTSNPMLNQLVSNIRWGQRGNFVSIPTDTPARDERLGWTGDISVFAPTASYFQDTRAFLSKWMNDVRDSQRSSGNIPAVVPQPGDKFDETGVGWADAVITVPYTVWRASGDEGILRKNWEAMQKFHRFVLQSATHDGNFLEEGRSCWFSGDWLSLDKVDRLQEHKVIATAYFAENTRMMAEMAAALGYPELSAEWSALLPKIRQAFTDAYVQPDGSVYTQTQTVYAMALGMGMVTDPVLKEKVGQQFLRKLEADGNHLRTGFLGTPWLLPALTAIGRDDLAFRLLLNEDYPSWGFEVKMGATTMWERWNTLGADGKFGPVEMNSFNHYAYGAVGDWMFRQIGGLQPIEPGYGKSRIAPKIGYGGLNHASARLQTTYGELACDWKLSADSLSMDITVPWNTTSEIMIPAKSLENLREGNAPLTSAQGITNVKYSDGKATLTAGSGSYHFIRKN
jgi:alpha-L-rhamnosidase